MCCTAAGKKADAQGGALKKDGAVGKEFTKEGSVGKPAAAYKSCKPLSTWQNPVKALLIPAWQLI